MHFNSDPSLHPFEKAREVTRALNAVKLERLFAKPFLGSLEGHRDGVYTMGKHYKELNALVSGSADGEVRLWNLSMPKEPVWMKKDAHDAFVRGVCFTQARHSLKTLSCSDDRTVKLWDAPDSSSETKEASHIISSYTKLMLMPCADSFSFSLPFFLCLFVSVRMLCVYSLFACAHIWVMQHSQVSTITITRLSLQRLGPPFTFGTKTALSQSRHLSGAMTRSPLSNSIPQKQTFSLLLPTIEALCCMICACHLLSPKSCLPCEAMRSAGIPWKHSILLLRTKTIAATLLT